MTNTILFYLDLGTFDDLGLAGVGGNGGVVTGNGGFVGHGDPGFVGNIQSSSAKKTTQTYCMYFFLNFLHPELLKESSFRK